MTSSSESEVHSNKYIKKQEKSQIKDLTLHLKELGKKWQGKPNVERKKEINIRIEIYNTETKQTVRPKNWVSFFEKINKIGKPLARLGKKKLSQTNQKWKRKHYNWYHRNTKGHKKLLKTIICQQIKQLYKIWENAKKHINYQDWIIKK